MIKKVLIAEDHESANISLQKVLEEAGIVDPAYAYYCDDALKLINTALHQGDPFDLLITDLVFEEDTPQQLTGGEALIAAAREMQPHLKVLVFSALSRPTEIKKLFTQLDIDGFVRKARRDASDLKQALESIDSNIRYIPRQYSALFRHSNTFECNEFDILLLTLLAKGVRQKDIPNHLNQQDVFPSGLSTVEKRLNKLKTEFGAATNEQLIAHCKDMGII